MESTDSGVGHAHRSYGTAQCADCATAQSTARSLVADVVYCIAWCAASRIAHQGGVYRIARGTAYDIAVNLAPRRPAVHGGAGGDGGDGGGAGAGGTSVVVAGGMAVAGRWSVSGPTALLTLRACHAVQRPVLPEAVSVFRTGGDQAHPRGASRGCSVRGPSTRRGGGPGAGAGGGSGDAVAGGGGEFPRSGRFCCGSFRTDPPRARSAAAYQARSSVAGIRSAAAETKEDIGRRQFGAPLDGSDEGGAAGSRLRVAQRELGVPGRADVPILPRAVDLPAGVA